MPGQRMELEVTHTGLQQPTLSAICPNLNHFVNGTL